MTLFLKPIYDGKKSFYNKAQVVFNEANNVNKVYTLYSYGVEVMRITKHYIYFMGGVNYSNTTMRHIRELLRQYGGEYDKYKDVKNSLYNMTKKHIIKGGYVFHNVLKTQGNTKQKELKGFNK